ncbi:MAG TPA: zinc-dependent metalloprotease [Longimicrobiales bacterium]|nr:zinc-dependent metalloprotease [Longimicrobiales bacterium]
MSRTTLQRAAAPLRFAPVLVLSLASLCALPGAVTAQGTPLPSIAEKTSGTQKMEGLFNLYWQENTGTMFWEIGDLDTEFLYSVSMGSGLGSNPIGIDRGQVGGASVLKPMRIGPRVLLMEPNYSFVANSENPMEVAAVRDAFAPSVHWGFDIVAESDGHVLVDATAFFLRDARGVVEQIARSGQGRFQLDRTRSAIYLPSTKSFPENTEVEAILTFTSSEPGRLVRGVAASGDAITLREHHSFIRLPGPGYQARIADPRIGVSGPNVADYATPIDEDMTVRLAARHRLHRKTPGTGPSEAVEPIVYYVDPGTPEPIRSALVEGASWWNQAYEAAGFIDAFQVKVLPDSIDPQDIRYNMIHWTHRQTRGYSYGNSIVDPRTGEIIRGVVNLGSLRLRQDYLHGQGMVAPFPGGISSDDGGGWFDNDAFDSCDLASAPDFDYLTQVASGSDAFEMALARVRQLSAHEVGHTLGFPHNYIASAYGRESVMDYPAPLVEIDANGDLDLSNAYLRRIGTYDKLSVDYLYREFPEGTDEKAALENIVRGGLDAGLRYVGHTNNNFIGAGHQYAGVWDNGANLVDHLKTEIRIRQIGLDRFGPDMIRTGEPLSKLEFVLLPLYMHHRFQLRSAVESLGGADYRPAVKGDGQTPITIVPGEEQRDALETVLSTLTVDFLALPERIVSLIPPQADRHGQGESFPGHTERFFDPLGAAEAAADFSVGEIFQPQRMARLEVFGGMGDYPDLAEVTDRVIQATWDAQRPGDGYHQKVQNIIQRAVVDRMMQQGSMAGNPTEVRAILTDRLDRLAARIDGMSQASPHAKMVAADIRRWQARTEDTVPGPKLQMPAGDPIGGGGSSR